MKALLATAEAHCETHGHRFTAPRRAVLEVISRSDKPVGAYGVIAAMPEGTKPPTVYRALEFWEKEGFIHRIGSLNAYTTCHAGHRHGGAQFLICDSCREVTEVHLCHIPADISGAARKNGFHLNGWFLELRGLCKECRAAQAPEAGTACQK